MRIEKIMLNFNPNLSEFSIYYEIQINTMPAAGCLNDAQLSSWTIKRKFTGRDLPYSMLLLMGGFLTHALKKRKIMCVWLLQRYLPICAFSDEKND